MMKAIKRFIKRNLHWFIVLGVAALCAIFIIYGHWSENGKYRTLDGKDAQIPEATIAFNEDMQDAMKRITEQDAPTDEETTKLYEQDEVGLGFHTTIDQILGRRLPDGDNDNGKGWQCSKYTAYLATGKREYSTKNPDYGPVNGKDVAAWLVKNYGFKYINKPVAGAIGSGYFNTQYGHTVMYLYSTGANTAMVNDANWNPLTVSTHNMNISGWKWVVPGDYKPTPTPAPAPKPTPTPAPAPKPVASDKYTVKKGDTLGGIAIKMGWFTGGKLYGDDGYAQALAAENNIAWRGFIFPGQVIKRK